MLREFIVSGHRDHIRPAIEAARKERLRFVVLRRLRRLDIGDGGFAGALVFRGVEGDLLALHQPTHSGALKRGGVDENVLAAIVRLNEAEAFLVVVEFHGARIHRSIPFADLGALDPKTRGCAT